jgi:sec-independent protein translocase protein TatB
MFNSFSFSELMTVLLVVVIVFGPNKLPEMARRLGQLASRARQSIDSLKSELGTEYQDVIEPIKGARDDLRGIRKDLTESARSVVSDLDAAASDVRGAVGDAKGAVGVPPKSPESAADPPPAPEPEAKGEASKDGES